MITLPNMRQRLAKMALICLGISFLVSCREPSENTPPADVGVPDLTYDSTIIGSWVQEQENGLLELSLKADHTFEFRKDSGTIAGTWHMTVDKTSKTDNLRGLVLKWDKNTLLLGVGVGPNEVALFSPGGPWTRLRRQ